jgi:hypothetical protein
VLEHAVDGVEEFALPTATRSESDLTAQLRAARTNITRFERGSISSTNTPRRIAIATSHKLVIALMRTD